LRLRGPRGARFEFMLAATYHRQPPSPRPAPPPQSGSVQSALYAFLDHALGELGDA
jgi:hypothetical protein